MSKLFLPALGLILTLKCLFCLLFSCSTVPDSGAESSKKRLEQKVELSPCPAPDSAAQFSEIMLMGFTYSDNALRFGVAGVTLGIKTPGAEAKPSQVSNKGVHLHVVINDSLHLLHYDNIIPYQITDGTYKMVAFTARSYHESIKRPQAAMSRNFQLRGGHIVKSHPNLGGMLVYSAPLGEFVGKDTKNILLDFFLMNTNLAPDGNRVRILIDEHFEFFVDRWQAYYIKGLIDGEHSIQMELISQSGQTLYGPLTQRIVCKPELN